jgi:hypothetical protein
VRPVSSDDVLRLFSKLRVGESAASAVMRPQPFEGGHSKHG